jgi:hypothetical protein
MKKIETIWHHLLWEALKTKKFKHTQQDLAKKFGYSLSTVNHALKVPEKIGAIRKSSKFFVLENFKKLLYYWASVRHFENNIIYRTYYPDPILKAQGELPAGGIYGAYTAASYLLGTPPADYDKIYYYYEEVRDFKKRFPENKKLPANIFVLKMKGVKDYSARYPGGVTTLPHTFVDIWNLSDWYATDFINALEEKMNEFLS